MDEDMPIVVVNGVRYWVFAQDDIDEQFARCTLLKVGGVSLVHDSLVAVLEVTW